MNETSQNGKDRELLTIRHMRKAFGDNQVLKDISLSVRNGEIVSVIGPSGSGKSTLLRCATMLETMDGGSLGYSGVWACEAVDGQGGDAVYASQAQLQKIHRSFGLVFQNFNLFPHYSVLKNVMDAPVRVLKQDREQAKQEALKLLEQFGLADKADAYPCELSGGQQQRVSVARALALKPEIMFLDEPTSALDPELTADVLNVLKQLAAQHMTMVIVTHELEFAREVSDRIIFVENGEIVEQGTPEQLFASDKQRVQEFIGKLSVSPVRPSSLSEV
ncbi:amino acid ABC transporter ATP-binding protein [Faecalibaculum rodentium]|uniref:amino acid ABC transporter ATP-binding protein n=1 Tax=Faecalibaculum rodentium TaxID=1702221 RepID=UPI0025A5318C|nr:amino acid ABC transporter ATP-binding protein [Faecalibaculum rodentium]